jgi:hypothetical protein
MHKISIINSHYDNGINYVTFKYWIDGECACSAKRQTASFDHNPTNQELINSIE